MAELSADVAVIGAGPAGMAAACAAAEAGARTVVVDDNAAPGGQIWRRASGASLPGRAARWRERGADAGVEILLESTLVDAVGPGHLVLAGEAGATEVRCRRLVLATGARERLLPFPGWTLPGVAGAGGLQALCKGGWPIGGRRVVVAGSGPLLLAVAAYLVGARARVVALLEQASVRSLAAFTPHLLGFPAKARQAAGLAWRTRGVRRIFSAWPAAADGDAELEAVVVGREGGRRERIECDFLACGFGLVPNVEVAAHLGCELRDEAVAVDAWQQSSRPEVLCAGEVCGIGGVDVAEVEGRIAGLVAAGCEEEAESLFARRRRERRFATALETTFALRHELRSLPREDTILCRCEDVSWGAAREFTDVRHAKLQTRCGMGSCQGRVCGAAGRWLLGWEQDRVRTPFFPVPAAALATAASEDRQ